MVTSPCYQISKPFGLSLLGNFWESGASAVTSGDSRVQCRDYKKINGGTKIIDVVLTRRHVKAQQILSLIESCAQKSVVIFHLVML